MKVILFQNIDGVGQKYELKEVKPGYFRNFLFPNGLAKEAVASVLAQIEALKQKESETVKARSEKAEKGVAELSAKTLILELKADEKGNLFAGLGAKRISNYIQDKLDLAIPAEMINIEKPIKQIGSYEVSVKDTVLKLEIRPQPQR